MHVSHMTQHFYLGIYPKEVKTHVLAIERPTTKCFY